MSGIAGIIYPDAFQVSQSLTPILDTLAHRGPPAEREEFIYKNMQIGITGGRLFRNPEAVVAFDGYLQNQATLTSQLQKEGFQFTTDQAAEVIAYAYKRWDNQFLEHLNGEFAFALIDTKDKKLLLARDRIGQKPLYWFENSQYFVFASELKGVLASGVVAQTPSMEGIAHYLTLGYFPQDLSPIKDVNKLLPCYYLQLNSDKSKMINAYWSFSAYCRKQILEFDQSFIQKFDKLFSTSICEEVPDFSPFGCLVSGGVGSASVAYYLQKCVPKDKYEAYSVAFEENIEDINAAEEVAKSLNLTHHYDIITPTDFLNEFTKIIWYLDEPIADPNVIATWRLSKLAASSRIVFSGMGSDELLAGHSRYTMDEQRISLWQRLIQNVSPLIKKYLLPAIHLFSHRLSFKVLQKIRSNPIQYQYIHKNAVFPENKLKAAAPRIASLFDMHLFLHKFYRLGQIPSTVSSLLYLDVKTRLVDCFIMQYERLLTANGLQWRAPFLSKEVMEWLASAKEPEKLAEKDTFFIMKKLLKNVFPVSFLYRPKKTRKNFLQPWLNHSQLTELFPLLLKGTLVESGIISEKWLQKQLSTPEQQKKSFSQLWSLLTLELWFRLYINKKIEAKPPELSVRELLLKN